MHDEHEKKNAMSPRGATVCRGHRGLGDQSATAQHVEAAWSSVAAAQEYAEAARSEATRRCYRRDFAAFEAWCTEIGVDALPAPPELVAAYLAHRAQSGARPSTVERALVGISEIHRAHGHSSPRAHAAVRTVMRGIRRSHGAAPRQARPLSVAQLRALLPEGDSLGALRDRALLLLGFAGGFRRSELVALDVADLEVDPEGLRVLVRRGKTDQEGLGHTRGIPYGAHAGTCPVRAVHAWIRAAGLEAGAVFRTVRAEGTVEARRLDGRGVARVLQKHAAAAGLDPTELSGHSLRSGFVTEAARAGATEHDIMRQTGHRSTAVLRTYIRRATVWESNAAGRIGL